MKKLAACIIETRSSINLIKIINDHLKFLPSETDLFIYHGRSHRLLKHIFPKATLVEISYEMNERMYNELLTSPEFWEQFLDYKKVLIFQHDSMILRPGIEEFMEMSVDFLGSEWKFPPYRANGGLSLRTPKIMYEICQKLNWDPTLGNEDVAICNYIINNGIGNLGSVEQCRKFACETILVAGSWGVHNIRQYNSLEDCEKIMNQYK